MRKPAKTLFGVLSLILFAVTLPAFAQGNYPAVPIRLVVGFGAGGITDVVARLVAQKLSVQMNASVIVEDKVGANGEIAAEFVAKSRPDGYTLLFAAPSQVFDLAFGQKLGYDLFKDLAPVAFTNTAPQVLFVHPSVPANTVAELVAYIKANPDKTTYGSGGTTTIGNLGSLLFLQAHGLTAVNAPYNGAAPMANDLIGGRLQFAMMSVLGGLPQVKANRLRALAVSTIKRSPLLPDVPTLSETGMPGVDFGSWDGVMVPAKTPPAIMKRLSDELAKAMQDPDLIAKLQQQGVDAHYSTPEEFGTFLKNDLERWTKLIKTLGLKFQ